VGVGGPEPSGEDPDEVACDGSHLLRARREALATHQEEGGLLEHGWSRPDEELKERLSKTIPADDV